MRITTDPTHKDLKRGVDTIETPQAKVYLVLSPEEINKGLVRPIRRSYIHTSCGATTRMSDQIAETYARDPKFYGSTYCVRCQKHLPVSEFMWVPDSSVVGS